MSQTPVFEDSFLNYLAANRGGVVGVAVSGGSDSVALLHMAHAACEAAGVTLIAASVNHGLRAEAQDECRFVAEICAHLGVAHQVLIWRASPQKNLQNEAREARFSLLADWARRLSAQAVLLGHSADDQAETVLMRLARGAGVDGLAGIADGVTRHGVSFLRPVLHLRREALRDHLRGMDQRWVEDPSNEDTRFERVRARQALAAGAFDVEALLEVAAQMRQAREALDGAVARLRRAHVREDRGDFLIGWRDYVAMSFEHKRRLILALMREINGAVYPPRRAEQLHLVGALQRQEGATLQGCLFTFKGEVLRISREPQAVRDVCAGPGRLWDGRWQIDGPFEPDLEVRALGEAGLRLCPDWRDSGLPRASLLASPAVWLGDALIAAPLAGFGDKWCATLTRLRDGQG